MTHWADNVIEKLQAGEQVTFRPRGHSMTPHIMSGQEVTLSPDISSLKKRDIVLARVKGRIYLHFIDAIGDDGRYMIVNARGNPNGWTRRVYGVRIK